MKPQLSHARGRTVHFMFDIWISPQVNNAYLLLRQPSDVVGGSRKLVLGRVRSTRPEMSEKLWAKMIVIFL